MFWCLVYLFLLSWPFFSLECPIKLVLPNLNCPSVCISDQNGFPQDFSFLIKTLEEQGRMIQISNWKFHPPL